MGGLIPGSDDVSITLGELLETDVVDFLRTALFEFNR
ncbi:MAG: hypothetical protein HW412_789, partial [Bacteroidetes bacterium]|nr:hypothetical protein [Bacteroidota bacterium]